MSIKPRALFSLFLGAAVACSSSSSTDERLDPAQFPEVCVTGLDALLPLGTGDAIQLRRTYSDDPFGVPSPRPDAGFDAGGDAGADAGDDAGPSPDAGDDAGPSPDAPREPASSYIVIATRGTPCATATDKSACLAKFATAPLVSPTWSSLDGYSGGTRPPPPNYMYYVVTIGDEVRVVSTRADLAALLAPVDTLGEAQLVLYGPPRLTSTVSDPTGIKACSRVRTDPDAFAFFGTECSGVDAHFEVVSKVSRDGRVTVTRTGPFEDPQDRSNCAPKP
jgi:hypothetical protein